MKRLLFLIFLGVVGALCVRLFLFEGIYLKTNSMAPSLPQGRHVFVNKMAYFFEEPQRGDIVMFPDPRDPEKDLIKRVIAVEGDILAIRDKQVILNWEPLREPYKQHLRADEILTGDNIDPVRIPEGHVFVMGDNRDYSRDSRDWIFGMEWEPFLPVEKIKGRVMVDS